MRKSNREKLGNNELGNKATMCTLWLVSHLTGGDGEFIGDRQSRK